MRIVRTFKSVSASLVRHVVNADLLEKIEEHSRVSHPMSWNTGHAGMPTPAHDLQEQECGPGCNCSGVLEAVHF
jgi:hypothetical protein